VRSPPIGLDIGTTVVRLLQVGGAERDLRVVEASQFAVPQEVKGDPKRRQEFIADGLRRLTRKSRFRGREAVMALPSASLAIRNVRLPKMSNEELSAAVNWEAQNKFPFDTATAIIQHLRAGEVHEGDQTLDEVILLAAPRAEVEAQIQLACEAGLDLVSLDAEPCAIFRGFQRFLHRREDEDVTSALADIGAQTKVLIAHGRDIVFLKTIPIGGAVFNRAVAESLDLAPAEAEALRRRLGRRTGSPNEDPDARQVVRTVADALRPHLEDLANEMELCLRCHSVTFHGPRPQAMTFSGGESHNADLLAALGERLGVEARPGDPLRGVRTDHLGPTLDRRGALGEWATVFGLSLKGFYLADQFAAGCAA